MSWWWMVSLGGLLASLVVHVLSLAGTDFGPWVWLLYFASVILYVVMARRLNLSARHSYFLFQREWRDEFFRPLPDRGKRILLAAVAYLGLQSALFIGLGVERTQRLADGTYAVVTRSHEVIRPITEAEFRQIERYRVWWGSSLAIATYWLTYLSFRYHKKRNDGEPISGV